MTGEVQPETTSGIPAPLAAKRPAIEITIRFDTDQLAELAGLVQGSPAESSPVPVMPSTALTGTEANLPAVTPDPMPPPKEERDLPPLVALRIAMSLAIAAGVLVDWQAAVTVLVIVLELFVVFRDGK